MKILAYTKLPKNLGYCTYKILDEDAIVEIQRLLKACDDSWGGEGYIDKGNFRDSLDRVLFFISENRYKDFKRVLKQNGYADAISLGDFHGLPQMASPIYQNFNH